VSEGGSGGKGREGAAEEEERCSSCVLVVMCGASTEHREREHAGR